MRLKLLSVLVLCCLAAGAGGRAVVAAPPPPAAVSRQDTTPAPPSPFEAVARRAARSVASIRVVRSVTGGMDLDPMDRLYRRFFPGDEKHGPARRGSGTGFLVSDRGYLLTNNHVVDGADEIRVLFPGRRRPVTAELVGADPATDLAVLKVPAEDLPPPLVFADSDQVRVGAWAIAVGNPFGNLAGSVTVGVISAKGRRDLQIHGGGPRYQDFLQTDAPINFGNSGGPLLDIAGRVIGVNTAINKAGQGIGFAIPANLARRVLEELVRHGRVIRAYVGIDAVDPADGGSGAAVTGVVPDSPAAAAGIRPGDLVTAVGGRRVADAHDLQFLVSVAPVGAPLEISLTRDGRDRKVTVVPVEAPREAATAAPRGWLGLAVAPLAGDDPAVQRLREALALDPGPGMLVTAVVPDSPAYLAGLREGDVLLEVSGQPVPDMDAWRQVTADLAGQRDPVSVLVRSGGSEGYRLIDPEAESPGR